MILSLTPPDGLSSKIIALRGRLFSRLEPPASLKLAEWAESNIVLPAEQSARPGRYRNWPYMTEILNSIGDPAVERVTVKKATRVGYTKALMIAIGGIAALDPRSIGLLVPVDEDVRDYVVDEIEPLFRSTPVLRTLIAKGRLGPGRNTISRKRFKHGGSLKVLSARSPRKMRKHDFKVLICDEISAMEITNEGDPLAIAEKRTFAHADRKIVMGSTPTEEDISLIDRAYDESDQRIYEIRCPHCHEWFHIDQKNLQWPDGQPELAACYCPACGAAIDERLKAGLVTRGRWRATRPDVIGHHGYLLDTFIALLPNAAWPKLAAEYEKAKRGGPAELQVYTNLVQAKAWKTSIGRVSAEILAGRVEPIGLDRIPPEIVLLTCGADVQGDRIEASVLGWPVSGAPAVLAHVVIDGNTLEDETWAVFDDFLKTRWTHPNGWEMRLDATAVDSGGSEGRTQKVYDFCGARLHRRVYAIAGRGGARPIWTRAQKVKNRARLWIIGHDQVKTAVLQLTSEEPFDAEGRLNPHALRVSDTLEPEWFEQLTNEIRRVRYVRNRAVVEFVVKQRGLRVEALDCVCYGWAVRQAPAVKAIDLRARAARRVTPSTGEGLPHAPPPRSLVANWAARFNE